MLWAIFNLKEFQKTQINFVICAMRINHYEILLKKRSYLQIVKAFIIYQLHNFIYESIQG